MGRIIEVFHENRGRIRSVKVQTAEGVYERPVVRCCLILPSDQAPISILSHDKPQEENQNAQEQAHVPADAQVVE